MRKNRFCKKARFLISLNCLIPLVSEDRMKRRTFEPCIFEFLFFPINQTGCEEPIINTIWLRHSCIVAITTLQ